MTTRGKYMKVEFKFCYTVTGSVQDPLHFGTNPDADADPCRNIQWQSIVDSAVVFYYDYWLAYFLFRGIALWGGKDFHQLQKFAHQGVQVRFQEIIGRVGTAYCAYKGASFNWYLEGPRTFVKPRWVPPPPCYSLKSVVVNVAEPEDQ